MKDVYVVNKLTGELLPAQTAIREFYRDHGILESWTDLYEETEYLLDDGDELPPPDFSGSRLLNI